MAKTAKAVSFEQWQEIKGVGEKAAESLYEYFHDENNAKEINELGVLGVKILLHNISKQPAASNAITDKTFVFTGTLPNLGRDEAKEMARAAGGEISSSVSKNTDYVIAGAEAGSKLNKAKALGVKIINEQEFLKLIK